MPSMGTIRTVRTAALLMLAVPAAVGQHHHHHAPPVADSLVWRMPPMDMSMPMLPGLEDAVPVTGPWLPPPPSMMAPRAVPGQAVELADGDTLVLEATPVMRTIAGRSLVMYGYNGQYPGPLIKVSQGTTITVVFSNAIDAATTVHWHGLRLDNRFDGIPGLTQDPVQPGTSFEYTVFFPDAGLYWYHPHLREDIQQDLGLYGNMVVDPGHADYYGPAHQVETLILDDILMDEHGILPYGADVPTHAFMGRFGNVMLTNGVPDYRIDAAPASVVRFHLTNAANARTFNVLFGGLPVKVVASDVSRFEREAKVFSVPIAPAERYTVDVQLPDSGRVAITNSIQAIDHFRGEFYPQVDTLAMVHVSGAVAAPDLSGAFQTLRTHPAVTADIEPFRAHFDRPPDHVLELDIRARNLPLSIVLSMEIDTLYVPPVEWNDAMPMMNWLSTGAQVEWILRDTATGRENMDIQWTFAEGDVVKVRLHNLPRSFHPMHHPIHFHGQRFLVLEMDGVRNTNLVWKDTAIVPVGSTVDFLVDMSNPGRWMAHCHIAEHLDSGMMLGFDVVAR